MIYQIKDVIYSQFPQNWQLDTLTEDTKGEENLQSIISQVVVKKTVNINRLLLKLTNINTTIRI